MTYDEFKARHQQMPKARKPISHPEDELQKACVQWFKVEAYPELAPLLFHPNNEAFYGQSKLKQQITGARMKAMGVTAGVADLILLVPGDDLPVLPGDPKEPIYQTHALCIEFKTRTGKLSNEQLAWQNLVQQHGYRYVVVRSLEDFKAITEEYLQISPKDPTQAAIDRLFGPMFKAKVHNKKQ